MRNTQTTLNLVIDHQVKEGIKEYAVRHKRTVSDVAESLFAALVGLKKVSSTSDISISPFIKSLHASVQLPADMDDKEVVAEMMMKKHG